MSTERLQPSEESASNRAPLLKKSHLKGSGFGGPALQGSESCSKMGKPSLQRTTRSTLDPPSLRTA